MGDLLFAELDDGQRLEQVDVIELAEILWAYNVTCDITAVDGHTAPIRAPLNGRKIAISSLLRRREKSAIPQKQLDKLTEDQLTKTVNNV